MSRTLNELKEKASKLSDLERAELALSLIESLDDKSDPDAEETWRVEILRRLDQIERGELKPMPGDEAFARLHRRLE